MEVSLHEITYDEKLLRDIVARAFPGKKLVSHERCAQGFMNVVIRIVLDDGARIILKLSDQKKSWSIEKEAFWFAIAEKHGIPVPHVLWHDFTRTAYPYEIIIVTELPGKSLEDVWETLTQEQQLRAARNAGITLAKIHSMRFPKPANSKGSELEEFDDFYLFYANGGFQHDLIDARELGYIDESIIGRVEALIHHHKKFLESYKTFCCTHMDYHPWHIFVDEKQNITGILDWGFTDVAVPERDICKLDRWFFNRAAGLKEAFVQGYTSLLPLSSDWEARVRFFRVAMDMKFIERLVKTNQDEMAVEYTKILLENLSFCEKWEPIITVE